MNVLNLLITLLLLLVTSFFVFIMLFDLINFFRGYAPNVASKKSIIDNIEEIYNFSPNQKVADFGAGYGNILWKLKGYPIKLTGIELNPILCFFLKFRFRPYENVSIRNTNFLAENLNDYDVIVVYGIPSIMDELEKIIRDKGIENIVVISNTFTFENIKHSKNMGKLYLYEL